MPLALLVASVVLLLAASARAQQPDTAPDPLPSRLEERVEVVGVTPIHGIGLPRLKVPANVQVFSAAETWLPPLDVPAWLAGRAASVQLSDAQGGAFQPDVQFRGFAASPLLGASQGLAVYQDGVRVNDPFGDTIHWDLLPSGAIASMNLMPGSNPLFGLNALGAALSIRTKDGFDFAGHRASITAGSFGRRRVEAESGGHGRSLAYFVAGSLTDEAGWRDFSPSTVRRIFGDVAWRGGAGGAGGAGGGASVLRVTATAASNDLTGNGPAPLELLDARRTAVFTHPDRTDNDLALLMGSGRRPLSDRLMLEGVAFYRHTRTRTFNGDAAEADEGGPFDAVNNLSATRGRVAGATAQVTRTSSLLGRDNHFVAGGGWDGAGTRFDFAAELARLTPDRGTMGAGFVDEDERVDLHGRVLTGSAFALNAWSVTDEATVTGSVRFNRTALRLRDQIGAELDGDHRFQRLNPAAGVTYQVRRWLNVYGSYTESSRVPTPVELTCADPEDPCRLPNAFVSDPPLKQVVGRTWEAGARGSAPARWSVAVFRADAADDIIFVSSGALRGAGHFQNVERTLRRGVEASAEYDLAPDVTASVAYTFQRATFGTPLRIASRFHPAAGGAEIEVAAGDRVPGVPTHSGRAGLSARLPGRLAIGADVRAQSGQFLRGDEANLLSPVPGFVVVSARAQHRITRGVSVLAELHNMLDARYYTFGVLGDASPIGVDDSRFLSPGAPRAGWIGVDVRF